MHTENVRGTFFVDFIPFHCKYKKKIKHFLKSQIAPAGDSEEKKFLKKIYNSVEKQISNKNIGTISRYSHQ